MTDEQINWAITEAIGADPHWKCAKGYCTDLNAMHDAEKVLIAGFEDEPESSEPWSDYQTNLILACPAYLSYHATARQRAEAFLRTLGKWKATDKESLTVRATTEESSVDHFRDATKLMEKKVQG